MSKSKLSKFYLGYEYCSTLRDEKRKIKLRTIKKGVGNVQKTK